jgi:hypothetical protein
MDEETGIFQEQTHEGVGSRLGGSFSGICFGLILFIGAFPLLWWNEGRAVDMYNAINEGRDIYVPIAGGDAISAANEGSLVYITGLAYPTENITDPDFGVEETNKIKLKRNVDMYQWEENSKSEKKKNIGGSTTTTTTYSYSKGWHTFLIDSSTFKKSGYDNPTYMPYLSQDFLSDVVLGDFTVPDNMIDSMASYSDAFDTDFDTNTIPSSNTLVQSMQEIADNTGFYFSTTTPNPFNATIGDTRVKYETAGGGDVSILAKQSGNTFKPYFTDPESDASLYRLEVGIVSAEQMFLNAEAENKALTWILRVLGIAIMSSGIGLTMQPLAVAADIIPCFGSCVSGAISFVATLIGTVLSFVVIGIAWVASRPTFLYGSLGALAAVLGLVSYIVVCSKKNKTQEPEIFVK